MNIFVICSVRGTTDEYRAKLEAYAKQLEECGHIVHLPHRDTNQEDTGLNICKENRYYMMYSDEVHIFYSPASQGTHFDMGVAFALGKKIRVIENVQYGEGKSYPRMLDEWQANKSFSA